MKVVITSMRQSLDSEVDPRFGRAQVFAIYDTEMEEFSYVENEKNLNAASGAGIQSAQNVANIGAEVVLTGNCGPKAFRALNAANIKVVIGVSGKLEDVVKKFINGEYEFADEANVSGHWS